MSEKMITELIDMYNMNRKLNKDVPYLSEFENYYREGANNILDEVELILSKYDVIHKYEIEQFSKEPKTIWGRIVFKNNHFLDSQYLLFIQEFIKFDTKDHIEERKNDKNQWDEFQDADSYCIEALFSEREANYFLYRFKGNFLLLEETLNEKGQREEIDKEWIRAYEEEEKAIYGERPTASQLVFAWNQNKEYFLANKEKGFGLIKKERKEIGQNKY